MSQIDPASVPPPLPVQPLSYSMPTRQEKPALVTAIAVLCIVVACLSGLFSFGIGMYGLMFYMASKVSTMAASATSVSSSIVSSSTTAVPLGLSPGAAGTAGNTLQKMLSLDAPRVRELDNLLRAEGGEVFGVDPDSKLTDADVRAQVKASAPASAASLPARFTTAQGTVQVYRDHAVFIAADGSPTVNTSAANNTHSVKLSSDSSVNSGGLHGSVHYSTTVSGAATQPVDATLTPAEVSSVMAKIKSKAPTPLKAAQLAAIKRTISAPDQQLITPGISVPVESVSVQSGGNATISFDGGVLQVGPNGQVISSMSTKAFSRGMGFHIPGKVAGLVVGEAGASVLLAIYLFIVGILAFRMAGKNGILLKIYALLKIPLALCAGAALPWMFYEFTHGITSAMAASGGVAPPAPALGPFIAWGCGIALLGLALPVGLLITLRARSVREYYNAAVIK